MLNINEQTFKSYYLEFEEQGMNFKRHNSKVLFTDDDLELFKEFLELKEQPKMTIKKAIQKLVSSMPTVKTTNQSEMTTVVTFMEMRFQQLEQKIDNQTKQLEHYQQVITNRLEQREQQTALFIEEWRKEREDQQQVLLETAAAEQSKKKIWEWLFFWRK